MVEMHQEYVGDIQVIHAVPTGGYALPLPTLFFYHGYTSSKEVYSYFGYALAQAGFRVILPDALMHGARFDGDEQRRLRHFWDILRKNIDELPALYTHYRQLGQIDGRRVGVCGASMGGMTALGALARFDWLMSAAALMGSGDFMRLSRTLFPPVTPDAPDYERRFTAALAPLADYDVFQRLDKLQDRPLLLWHGEADPLVPPAESARLYQALRARAMVIIGCAILPSRTSVIKSPWARLRRPWLFSARCFSALGRLLNDKCRTLNAERQTPNAECRMPNAERSPKRSRLKLRRRPSTIDHGNNPLRSLCLAGRISTIARHFSTVHLSRSLLPWAAVDPDRRLNNP